MTLPTAAAARLMIPELTGTSEDSDISTLITRADAVLAGWCGFPPASAGAGSTLEATTYTHYLHGPSALDARALRLPVRPVASVTSVHDDRDRDWSYGAADLVASGDYTLDGVEGVIWLHDDSAHGGWSSGARIIKVIYSAGYDTGSVPELTQAIVSLVAFWWAQRWDRGLESFTEGDTTQTPAPSEIPAHVREMAWPFRLPEAGLGAGHG